MPAFAAVNKKRLLMLPSFRDFGFAEWWKGIAVVLTGISAGAVRDVVGIRRGAISGNMKVSFQAARSIG
jgi:hypothetical protein